MSIQYLNKNCPMCGGNVVLLANGAEVCEKCHYVLPPEDWGYDSTNSTSSAEKYCDRCHTKLNPLNDWWYCPECGHSYRDYIGDPISYDDIVEQLKKITDHSFYIKSDGTANAWGALDPKLNPQTLTITNCEKFKVQLKEIDIEFELDPDKLENIDTIVINGYKYVKEK